MRRISDLILYSNNARTHSDEQIEQIAKSIEEFGFINPVIIDESNNVIAGHGRVAAAVQLGIQEVPTVLVDHLSEQQKKAYIIADNQLATNADWDRGVLKEELELLDENDFEIALLGFDDGFIDEIFSGKSLSEDETAPIDFDAIDEKKLDKTCPKCGYEFD